MMDHQKRFHELVDKHLNGDLSTGEKNELESHYRQYERKVLTPRKKQEVRRTIFQQLLVHLGKVEKTSGRKRTNLNFVRIAASLALIIALGATLLNEFKFDRAEVITIATGFGERKEVVLPDSSTVTLNAGSSISYPSFFDTDIRQVTLKGEAFFQIEHNPDQPFLVSAAGLTTKVLGTTFNINAYGTSEKIKVSLKTGSVQVDGKDGTLAILKPDEQLLYNSKTGIYSVLTQKTDNDTSWMKNILKLNDHSLQEAQKIVERWFNVELQIESNGEVTQQTITGKFIDPKLDETLHSLELLTGTKITYKKQNHK